MRIILLIVTATVLGGALMIWLQPRERFFPSVAPLVTSREKPFLAPSASLNPSPTILPRKKGPARSLPLPASPSVLQEPQRTITLPNILQPVSTFNTSGTAFGIFLANHFVYVADGDNGLVIIDISAPAIPRLRGTIKTGGPAHGVLVAGSYAYVAIYQVGLEVINIANPDHPFSVMILPTAGYTKNLAIEGVMLYASNYQNGVLLVDINDPIHSHVRGVYSDNDMLIKDIAPFGDVAFVADAGRGLIVLDVSDPSKPTLITTKKINGSAMGITRVGSMLFVANDAAGIAVFDAHNPHMPILVATYPTAGFVKGVVPLNSGSLLAVASFYKDIALLLDISDPRNPRTVSAYHSPGQAHRVAVSGAYMAIANDKDGIALFDLSIFLR